KDADADPLGAELLGRLTADSPLATLKDHATAEHLLQLRDGRMAEWLELLRSTPALQADNSSLDEPVVEIGRAEACDNQQLESIRNSLRALIPWRKGPFRVYGIDV